jgi:hypothetical protein
MESLRRLAALASIAALILISMLPPIVSWGEQTTITEHFLSPASAIGNVCPGPQGDI